MNRKCLNEISSNIITSIESPQKISDIILKITSIYNDDINEIVNAIIFSYNAHYGQQRKTGGPYIIHPLRVCLNAIYNEYDTVIVISSVLHDVLEDCDISDNKIKETFGNDVYNIVRALTKPEKRTPNRHEKYKKQLSENIYASVIKIIDIDDNLYDINQCMSGKSLDEYTKKQEKLKQFLIGLIDVDNIRKNILI